MEILESLVTVLQALGVGLLVVGVGLSIVIFFAWMEHVIKILEQIDKRLAELKKP